MYLPVYIPAIFAKQHDAGREVLRWNTLCCFALRQNRRCRSAAGDTFLSRKNPQSRRGVRGIWRGRRV